MVSSPKPPDPDKTAAAQSGMNRDTALTTQAINMVNQVTPDGNLTYSQNGNSSFVDSKGNTVYTPTYTATTSLSPQQQAIKAQTDAASLNLGKLANTQSAAISDQLSKPFKYTTSDAEDYAYKLGAKRIDPRFAQDQDNLRSQLIASGLRPGTPAFDDQMAKFGQTKNDAYNSLALGAQQQGYQQAFSEYNNPINTISALMSGSQVQNPQFTNTPSTNVGGVDYTGLVNSNYQAKVQNQNAAMGGLFGLASAGIKMLPFSDRRLKVDIIQIDTKRGLPWYSFRYLWDKASLPLREGFMADDVLKVMPQAVHNDPNGFHRVDYDMVLGA